MAIELDVPTITDIVNKVS